MTANPVRVLVVDDSALYRKIIRDALTGSDDIEVVGTAHNGQAALEKMDSLQPDLLTLDLEMPELGGLDVLTALRTKGSRTGAIMCSSQTSRGASITTQALEMGAFDFVVKPEQGGNAEQSLTLLRGELLPKVRAFGATRGRVLSAAKYVSTPVNVSPGSTPAAAPATMAAKGVRPDIVVIGVSTGGPMALNTILPKFPADFPLPILIVQHMPPLFTKSLADDLNKMCPLRVQEAADGDAIRPGQISIAPGGKQMKVEFGPQGFRLKITDDAPERNCKPSVDYLFRSVANNYGGKVLGIILTGMGDDGTEGCRALKKCRATIWAQDEASCVVYGMPRSIVDNQLADQVLPLQAIPSEVINLVNGKESLCR
jgi:two-component system chemotaxis response regulator CheB